MGSTMSSISFGVRGSVFSGTRRPLTRRSGGRPGFRWRSEASFFVTNLRSSVRSIAIGSLYAATLWGTVAPRSRGINATGSRGTPGGPPETVPRRVFRELRLPPGPRRARGGRRQAGAPRAAPAAGKPPWSQEVEEDEGFGREKQGAGGRARSLRGSAWLQSRPQAGERAPLL